MPATIDSLEIRIQAQASTAAAELDKLYNKLGGIAKTLSGSSTGMNNLAKNTSKLSKSLQGLSGSSANFNATAQGIRSITYALSTLGSVDVSSRISRLMTFFSTLSQSTTASTQVVTNIQAITQAFKEFFNAMSSAPIVREDTLRMAEALVELTTGTTRTVTDITKIGTASTKTGSSMSALTRAAKAVSSALGKVASVLGSVASGMLKANASVLKFALGLNKLGSHSRSTALSFTNLLRAVLPFYGLRGVFNWMKEGIALSSDLTEVQNVVEHAFGEQGTQAVEDFAKTSIDSFGMSELTAKRVASRYQSMGVAMGITTKQVSDATTRFTGKLADGYDKAGDSMSSMSLNLTRLAADMASFYNTDQESVAESLNAIYTGQTRPLRQFGLDLTQATLAEWAAKQGLDANIASMSQAEKTMLRYQYVMSQTTMVQGDFARTSFTWANQVRILKQNFEVFSKTVGEILINVFRPLIIWLNGAVKAVTSFAETIGNALGKIFGWKIYHTPAAGTVSTDMDEAADALEGVSDSAGDTADNIDKAVDSAKELSRTILGFDEINKLNDASSPSKTSSGTGTGTGASAGTPSGIADASDFAVQKVDGLLNIEAYKSKINSLFELGRYISDTLTKALQSIKWPKVYATANQFGKGLAEFLNGLITPELFGEVGASIARALNTKLHALNSFALNFDWSNFGTSLGTGIRNYFLTYDFQLAGSTFANFANGIVTSLSNAIDEIPFWRIGTLLGLRVKRAVGNIDWEKVVTTAGKFGTSLASFLNGLITPDLFSEVGKRIATMLNAELVFLNLFGKSTKWKIKGTSVAAGINNFFAEFDFSLLASTLNEWALGMLDAIQTAIADVEWKEVGEKIREFLANIKYAEIFQGISDIIAEAINGAIDLAKGLINPEELDSPFTDALNRIQSTVETVSQAVDWANLSKAIKKIVNALKPALGNAADKIATLFEAVGNLTVSVLNAIPVFAGAIEKLVGGLNKLRSDNPAIDLLIKLFDAIANWQATQINNAASGVKSLADAVAWLFGLDSKGDALETTAEGVDTVGGASANAGNKAQKAGTQYAQSGRSLDQMGASAEQASGRVDEYTGSVNQLYGANSRYTQSAGAASTVTSGLNDTYGGLSRTLVGVGGAMDGANASMGKVSGMASQMAYGVTGAGQATTWTTNALSGLNTESMSTEQKMSLVQKALTNMGNEAGGAAGKNKALEAAWEAYDPDHPEQSLTDVGNALAAGGVSAEDFRKAFIKAGEDAGIEFPKSTQKIVTATADASSEVGKNADKAGSFWTKGLAGKITEGAPEVYKASVQSASQMEAGARDATETHSPSRVAMNIGADWISGLSIGMKNKQAEINSSMHTIIRDVVSIIRSYNDSFKMAGSTLAAYAKSGLNSVSFSDVVSTWYNSMSFSQLNSNMYIAGQNVGTSFVNGLKSTYMPRLQYYISAWNTHSMPGNGTSYTPVYSPWWYAQGGFPNMGELFWANEKGPEMVGKMGHRNVVANNMQITAGIKAAVIDGMMQVYMATNGGSSSDNRPIVVEAVLKTENDEVLARAVQRGQQKRNARFNTVAGAM